MSNIYQEARVKAKITQEKVADNIGISVESIRTYESGSRIPTDDVVLKMVNLYNSKILAYQHLLNSSKIARSYLPEIKPQELSMVVLCLQKELHNSGQLIKDTTGLCLEETFDKYDLYQRLNKLLECVLNLIFNDD